MTKREIPRPPILVVWEMYGGTLAGNQLAGKPGWAKARCCLHEDRSPSAAINQDEDKYKCFVCNVSGDAIDLIMRHDDIDFAAALVVADEILASGGGPLRGSDRPETSLVPRRPGHRQGRRNWTPPWIG